MGSLKGSVRRTLGRAAAMLIVAAGSLPDATAASWIEINTGLPALGVGVNSLVIDPASPSTIYALTVSNSPGSAIVPSLFKTTDGGGSWKPVGSVSGVASLVIDPLNSSTLYAGTDQGVVKSTNAGESWTDVSHNLPAGSVTKLVIDPSTPSTLYAVTTSMVAGGAFAGGPISTSIFKTTDSGGSWSMLNTGLPTSAYITVLAIAPATPSTIYTYAPPFNPTGPGAPTVGGLLKSVDGGQSWSTLIIDASVFVSSLVVDPVSSSILYANTSRGLLKSVDGGQTWNSLNSGLPPNTNVTFVVIDRAAPSSIYAAATTFGPTGPNWSVLKSTDGGGSWSTFNVGIPPNTAINSLVLDPVSPARIYAGAVGVLLGPIPFAAQAGSATGGVFKSTDGGETWNASSAGLSSFDVRTVATSPSDVSTIYAGGYGGTSKSTDGGATWNTTGLSTYTGSLVADAVNPGVLYALTGRTAGCDSSEAVLFSTADGGANWSNSVSPLNSGCVLNFLFQFAHPTPVVIDPTDPNTLYMGESDDQDGYSAVLKSTDRGANWRAAWDWFNGLRGGVRALAADPARSGTIYAGIDDGMAGLGAFQPVPGSSGLFKSTDGGVTWSDTRLTIAAVSLLAIDPANSQVIYAGTEGHYSSPKGFQGLFKSADGGKSWTPINAGLADLLGTRLTTASALVIDPADSRILYLGTSSGGVFRSADGGANWSPFSDGLPSLQVRALSVAPGAVYAATSSGVFKYPLE